MQFEGEPCEPHDVHGLDVTVGGLGTQDLQGEGDLLLEDLGSDGSHFRRLLPCE